MPLPSVLLYAGILICSIGIIVRGARTLACLRDASANSLHKRPRKHKRDEDGDDDDETESVCELIRDWDLPDARRASKRVRFNDDNSTVHGRQRLGNGRQSSFRAPDVAWRTRQGIKLWYVDRAQRVIKSYRSPADDPEMHQWPAQQEQDSLDRRRTEEAMECDDKILDWVNWPQRAVRLPRPSSRSWTPADAKLTKTTSNANSVPIGSTLWRDVRAIDRYVDQSEEWQWEVPYPSFLISKTDDKSGSSTTSPGNSNDGMVLDDLCREAEEGECDMLSVSSIPEEGEWGDHSK